MSNEQNQASQTVTLRIIEGDGGEEAIHQAKKLLGDTFSVEQLRRFQKLNGQLVALIQKDPKVLEHLTKHGVDGLRSLGIEVDKDIAEAAERARRTNAAAAPLGEEPIRVEIRIGQEQEKSG